MILLGRALEAFIMECGLRFNRVPLVTKSLMALAAVLLIATPALAMGMVGVSGEDLTIDGERASGLGGVDESTALIFALQAYCHGQVEDWGRNMNFPGPDTGQLDCDSLLELWHQYFWLCDHYDLGLVRIGASDMWGSKVMHEAWLWHRAAFMDVLSTMLHEAEEHGVYVCLVLAGSQQYPLYAFGGSGSVLDSSSQAYANYISYCTDVISNVDAMNSTAALFSYDVWNEPDHLSVNKAYWAGDQLMFRRWAEGVSSDICPLTEHIVEMGTGGYTGLGGLWPTWSFSSFLNITGLTGFDVCHLHFYASAQADYLVTDPLNWSAAVGKPLHWGELARNDVYPLQRWSWFESKLAESGADAWCNMVLRGMEGYPFTGSIPEDLELPTEDGGDEIVPEPPVNETTPENATEFPPPPNNDTAPGNGTGLPPPSDDGNATGNETAAPPPSNGTSSPDSDASGRLVGGRGTFTFLASSPFLIVPMAFVFMIMAVLVLSVDRRRRF